MIINKTMQARWPPASVILNKYHEYNMPRSKFSNGSIGPLLIFTYYQLISYIKIYGGEYKVNE